MVKPTSSAIKPRVRRSVTEARRTILDAAQRRLIAGGPDAVRVQTVAADVGVTDAAVHYHFGNRDGLLDAVLKDAGRRMRDDLEEVVAAWDPGTLDIADLAQRLRTTLEAEGHARLTAWMVLRGWKPHGSGMLRPLAERIHLQRLELAVADDGTAPTLEDTLFAVELLSLIVWGESLVGHAWRRSVGLPADRATAERFMDWVVDQLGNHLRLGTDLAADAEHSGS